MHPDFKWAQLGDIQEGRPHLGGDTKVAVYRLMHFSLRTVLERACGKAQMKQYFFEAGHLAGGEFCRNLLDTDLPFSAFLAQLQKTLLELRVGILKVEKADSETMSLVVTVAEDLDCSGLPLGEDPVCNYDEGFMAGLFEVYAKRAFVVEEVDCWSTGGRTCRFTIQPQT